MNARSLTYGEDLPLSYKVAIVQSVIANLEQRTAGSQRTSFVVFFPVIKWLDGWSYIYPFNPFVSSIVKSELEVKPCEHAYVRSLPWQS